MCGLSRTEVINIQSLLTAMEKSKRSWFEKEKINWRLRSAFYTGDLIPE
jgi:hypothetical protein